MTQKVLQVGSSAGMTISKDALKKLGIRVGDQISVEIEGNALRVTPMTAIDGELVDWTKNFVEKYRPALEALKDK